MNRGLESLLLLPLLLMIVALSGNLVAQDVDDPFGDDPDAEEKEKAEEAGKDVRDYDSVDSG